MVKKSVKKSRKQSMNNKLDSILRTENNLLREEKNIEKEEKRVERKEEVLAEEERGIEDIKKSLGTESSDIQKLEKLEEEIKAEVGEHPLAAVTLKDITKGLVGAFIGLAIHYTFVYGVEISEKITVMRATLLFPLTFIVGLLFIYATGFRKVKDTKILMFMPIRLLVLYVCALIMSVIVLYIFYPTFGHNFEESYKMVAGVMLAAVVGACTADLLGKE